MKPHLGWQSGFGCKTVCGLIALVLVLNFCGLFQATDGILHDLSQRFAPTPRNSSSVLLVYLEKDQQAADRNEINSLLLELNKHEPKKIGVLCEGVGFDERMQLDRSVSEKLVLGMGLETIGQTGTANSFPKVGFTDLHLVGQATYRNAIAKVGSGDKEFFSFEAQLARHFVPPSKGIPSGAVRIRFADGIDSLPNVKASEVLNGNTVSELVRDKIVLIGMERQSTYGLVTPVTSGAQRMSRLEVRGNIVETLVRAESISSAGKIASAVTLILLILLFSQLARQLPNRWTIGAMLICMTMCLVLAICCSRWLHVSLPLSGMIFAALSSFMIVIYQRFNLLSQVAEYWRLMSSFNSNSANGAELNDVWGAVADATYQMFYPKRLVLMELESGATHLKVVKTIHCEESQIAEKRRDIQRTPYKVCLAQKMPVRTTDRTFFKTVEGSSDVEYMVPLYFAGKTIGFMVMEVAPQVVLRWKGLEKFLTKFAEDISMLVAENRAIALEKTENTKLSRKLISLPEQRTFDLIQLQKRQSLDLGEQVDQAFEQSESALAIYDMFGQIRKRNSKLIRFLQEARFSITQSTCIDLISTLGNRSKEDSRRTFRQAIIENRSERIFIPPTKERLYPCFLFIKPIQISTHSNNASIESQGILVEIAEGKYFEQANQWQDELTDSMCNEASGSLQTLLSRTEQLCSDELDPNSLETLVHSLHNTIVEVGTVLQEWQSVNRSRISEDSDECLQTDTKAIWDATSQDFAQRMDSRNIRLAPHFTTEDCVALANPFLLSRVFDNILGFLIDNALDDSEIFVGAETTLTAVHYRFQNTGGATPIEGLRQSMMQTESDTEDRDDDVYRQMDSEYFDRFSQIKHWLDDWGGTLLIRNQANFGMSIELTLRTDRSQTSGRPSETISKLKSND